MSRDDDVRERVKMQFGKNAKKYVESKGHSRPEDLDRIVDWLSPDSSWICLDIATGGGHATKAISKYVKAVVASDLTIEMLEESRKHHAESGLKNIIYVIADAEELPFPNFSFDAVICRIAPHHFANKEKFVSEAFRVLKRGGKFLLIDNVSPTKEDLAQFMNRFEWLRDNSHVSCISLDEWKRMLSDAGFKILKSETRRKEFSFDTWVRRTTESEQQITDVTQYLMAAGSSARDYFKIITKGSSIESIEIDEGAILAVRTDSVRSD